MTEQQFVERWWKDRFPGANPPTRSSPITFTDALDLLSRFRKAVHAATKVKETHFLEGWWQRKLSTAEPLGWDTFMTLADAEDLLTQYRECAEVLWPTGMRTAS